MLLRQQEKKAEVFITEDKHRVNTDWWPFYDGTMKTEGERRELFHGAVCSLEWWHRTKKVTL